MTFNHRKSVTWKLTQAARAYRTRAGVYLGRIGLHPGQEAVLKALAETDGLAMSDLAHALGVQPPTVTKMISRLSAQGLVVRKASTSDGRQALVHLTDDGKERIEAVDQSWKRLEKEALAGLDEKDRKKLRKLLRHLEGNLSGVFLDDADADMDADPIVGVEVIEEV